MMNQTNNPLLEKLPWAIIIINIELKVVNSNAAARELFNLKAGDKTFLQDFAWVDQSGKTLPLENHPVAQCFKTGKKFSRFVMGFYLPSEKQITWIETHCIPEFGEGNQKTEQVVFTFNITTQPKPLKFDIAADHIKSISATDDQRIFESDVLNRINQAVIVSDLQGNITYTNEAASKMYGWTREEFSERNVLDTTVPDRSSIQASQIMKKLANGESWSGEFEVKRKDGTIFTAFVTDTPIFNKQGILIGIIGVSLDITKDKKAETDLISSENRFLIMFRSNPTPSGITRASDFRIVDVNDAWCKLTGYSREEAIGYNPAELGLVNPDILSKVRSISQNYNAAQQAEIELRTRNSEIRQVLINSELIEMGGEKFVLNNLLDITARKLYEEQLTKLAERLNLATYSAGIGIWDWDIQKNTLVWDEQMVALYGLQPGGFKGAYESWLNGVHPDDRDKSDLISQSAVRGESEFNTEFRVLWPDGSVHWLKADGRVIRDENDNAIRMVGVNYDITERKLAEEKLRVSEERYRELAENFPDTTITFYNRELKVTFVTGEELYKAGKTAGDFMGKRFDEILIPQLAAIAEKSFKRAFNGEINTFDAKSFNERYLKVIAVPVYDSTGIINEIQVISQNITESKKAEQKRLISEQKYTLLFEESGTPSLVFKFPGGIISEVNRKIEELIGYTKEELVGKNSIEVGFVKPENRDKILEVLMRDEPIFDFELPITAKNGESKNVLVNAVHFYINDVHHILTTWFDITARKLAEQKLHESEQKLKLFVEFAPAAIAMFDTDMRYIAVSRRFLIDYGIREKTIIGRTHYEIFPEIGEEWKAVHRHCLAGASEIKEEDRFQRADGSVDWVHWEIHPWYQTDEKIGGIILFSELITERKKALNALEEKERRLRKTIETTSDGFWIVDRDRRFIEVNEAYCTMSGYSRAELMAMNISDIEAIETTTDTTDHIQKIIRLGSDRFETIHRRKDGSLFDVEVSVNVLDQEQELMICFCRDITERKQAEKQIRESEKRFATIFEDSPVGIAISRLKDGKIIMVNSAIIDLLGYIKDELIGQTTNDLGVWINPDDRQRFVESLSTEQRVEGMEATFCLKSGEKRQVMLWGELIELAGESCMMAEVIDITERKKAEQQLREREAELNDAQVLAKMASWRIDLTNYQLSVSDNYRQLIGIVDDSFEISFDYFIHNIHPDDVVLMNPEKYNLTPDSPPVIFDFRMRIYDKTMRWFQNSMVGEFSDGKLVALKGTNIDITEKKNREEEIRLQNQKLNAILNALPDKLFVHDATGNFLEAYTTDPSGFIVPMEKFIGKNLRDIFPADVADLNLKYLYEARESNKIISHEFSVDYKGIYSHFEVRVVPFLEDKVIRFVRDITEKKNREEEIQSQNQKLNAILNALPDRLFVHDSEGNYLEAYTTDPSGFIAKMDNFIGKNILDVLPKDVGATNLKYLQECLEKKKILLHELSFDYKGTYSHFEVRVVPFMEDKVIRFVRDITERKEIEKQIVKLNKTLFHEVCKLKIPGV